ncbi:MAG TPA: VWA domain-containing protein, partial [Verrucomicrobiae bacterium]|nr:VWA domain-containing protein [Verrucomicrobiae bacterium]
MTEIFLKLLGANVDNGVDIAKASLALRGGFSIGGYVFLVLVFGALVYWMYRNSPTHLTPVRKYTLAALRTLFLGLLLMLLLRPVLAFTVEGSVRRLLVVLMDNSSSMQIQDPRRDPADQKRAGIAKGILDPAKGMTQGVDSSRQKEVEQVSRAEIVKAVFKNEKLNLLPYLDREFELDAFAFAQGVAPIATGKEEGTNAPAKKDKKVTVDQFTWVDRLNPTNPTTAIGDAIREIMNRKRGQPLAGVILVTDGANNSGSQPREVAGLMRQEGLPLYVYGVGITRPRDI